MQFLSKFRWISWIRMLKTLNMALIRCPVGIFEEIIAVFQIKKSQIDAENDKKPPKISFPFFKVFTHFSLHF